MPGDPILFGASRPGYPSERVNGKIVDEWTGFMRAEGVARVVCLLDDYQLAHYHDLLGAYRSAFGPGKVLSAPVPDYRLPSSGLMIDAVLPFVREALQAGEKTVIHCSAGCGRTGFTLAACLVAFRGLSNAEAIATVARAGRNACESGDPGAEAVLDACRKRFRAA